jgi:glycosyltransferase involved in cell wall biosynthesis
MVGIPEMPPSHESVIVAHLCARQHYAVPIAFEQAGMLKHFYTDLWVGKGLLSRAVRAAARVFPSAGLKKWAGRYDARLPSDKVTAFTSLGLNYARWLRAARTPTERTETYLWAGQMFGRLVTRRGLDGASAVYGVYGGARIIFEAAKRQGLRTILDQMSCPQLYRRLEAEERERWPGWEVESEPDALAERAVEWENAELALADVVLCPSGFVVSYVRSLGVPNEKIRLVPYGIPIERFAVERTPYRGDRPLRLLFVGGVSLMKGVPYLLEALRLLNSDRVEARLVGPVVIREAALAPYRRHCEIVGPVPRSEILRHYAWADVFVFPSICDSFGVVMIEALAAGLPAICTPNTGAIVRDGQDGFVVPLRDPQALAAAIGRLLESPDFVAAQSARAVGHAAEFSEKQYGQRLTGVLMVSANG